MEVSDFRFLNLNLKTSNLINLTTRERSSTSPVSTQIVMQFLLKSDTTMRQKWLKVENRCKIALFLNPCAIYGKVGKLSQWILRVPHTIKPLVYFWVQRGRLSAV